MALLPASYPEPAAFGPEVVVIASLSQERVLFVGVRGILGPNIAFLRSILRARRGGPGSSG